MYENMYPLVQFILDLHTHVCMHAHPRTCTPARKTHPARMLTFLFSQDGKTAVEHAGNDKVKAAFVEHAEHSDITDDNKDTLLLLCARLGLASRVRAVLQAGANAGHINQVRVRARFRGSGSWVSVCLCPHVFSYRAIHDIRIHVHHT